MTERFANVARHISYGFIGLGLAGVTVASFDSTPRDETNVPTVLAASIAWLGTIGAIGTFRDPFGELVINKKSPAVEEPTATTLHSRHQAATVTLPGLRSVPDAA